MSAKLKNRSVVPQGMLAPSGYHDTVVDPAVQSTTRPPGSILGSSPGYDTIRPGKNRFQGKGPTGGFRPMEFAEDVGNTGAALSVIPGDISAIEETQWLPSDEGDFDEGTFIVADRAPRKRVSHVLHEIESVIPDMGDRSPGRPRSRMLYNPVNMFRSEYREHPAVAIAVAAGLVTLAWIVGNDLEREYVSRRGKGVASSAAAAPEAAAATGSDETDKVSKNIERTVEGALGKIENAANSLVTTIEDTVKSVNKE